MGQCSGMSPEPTVDSRLVDEYAVPILPSRDLEETLAFYTRLETKTDDELDRCGLPRVEVGEGKAEVRRMTNDQ